MKKVSIFAMLFAVIAAPAMARPDDAALKKEVRDGLLVNVSSTSGAVGQLGADVYAGDGSDVYDLKMFIPTDMYIRGGVGTALGFMSGAAKYRGAESELSGGLNIQMALGWNLSSFVRAELDFQAQNFKLADKDVDWALNSSDANGYARGFGGAVYFDLARRYVRSGDITVRRTFVPYIGFGAYFGALQFNDVETIGGEWARGHNEWFIAPRFMAGFNVAITDLVGIDLTYQYSMIASHGFGWQTHGSVMGVSDLMATIRFNF